MRFRELIPCPRLRRYVRLIRYRFTETYELGWPGKDLEHYFTNRWTRTAHLDAWD